VCNMIEPGDTMLIGINGYFGNRLVDMASRYGAKVCLSSPCDVRHRRGFYLELLCCIFVFAFSCSASISIFSLS